MGPSIRRELCDRIGLLRNLKVAGILKGHYMINRGMDTITSVLNNLKLLGQDNEFIVDKASSVLLNGKSYGQEDIMIIKTYRFEGESDPADGAIIYLIKTPDGTIGYSLDAYGVYTNHSNDGYADLIGKLALRKQ